MSLGFAPLLLQGHPLLTDPMLANPTPTSVNVVWFTEFEGVRHFVEYGEGLKKKVECVTTKLSRMRQEAPEGCKLRLIYRHEAKLKDLSPDRIPYRVVSAISDREVVASQTFTCAPAPSSGKPLKILLTSDHQLKPMVAANLQKAQEVAGRIDAIFFAGDCVDHADDAHEWFDHPSGGGFFPCLQGKARRSLGGVVYQGAPFLQVAPMFCAIGNHEVMGRWSMNKSIDTQFNDTYPLKEAEEAYQRLFPSSSDVEHRRAWIKDHSFNTDSYEEIFSLPQSPSGGKKYYAVSYGDVRLVVLYATRIWRHPKLGIKGKYTEDPRHFEDASQWGYGDFIFESLEKESPQYQWLESELQSENVQKAKYKIVMLHNPLHSLGENAIPPFANPIQQILRNKAGKITEIKYHYPKEQDMLIRDIEPLLEKYGVDVVLCGHTHVWNRFKSPGGVHHLETSNVGNSYGAYLRHGRNLLPGRGDDNYIARGDPYGLTPIVPTLAPLRDAAGTAFPYLSSNETTAFSILNTETGAIDSYYFDTTKPTSSAVHFDRFYLGKEIQEASTIKTLQEYAEKHGLPNAVVVDVDNTLIESERQIGLDPSVNGFLRKKFPTNSEEVIVSIQAIVPWRLCEKETADVVKFFQMRNVKVIGVTKRSPALKESLHQQLKRNGIDLSRGAPEELTIEGGVFYKGVLYVYVDKGTGLYSLFDKLSWPLQDLNVYIADDRREHLRDYLNKFRGKLRMKLFEYTHTHCQQVDLKILELQLQAFLSKQEIKEDSYYSNAVKR